jgi:TetR/AcrR family transcriptional regulator, transcriptional repressor for nem operon
MAGQNTREHLIEVGLEQIRTTGYAATGVQEILRVAGVPKGSFYHYFDSKEAFTEEVLQRYAEAEGQRLATIVGDSSIAPLVRLRQYFEALARVYEKPQPFGGCLLGNLSIEIADHSPRLQAVMTGAFDRWQQGVAAVLHEAADRGELPDGFGPDDLAGFLVNGWEGALVRMKAEQSQRPLLQFVHFVFDTLLKR